MQTFSEIAIRRDKFDFGASFTPADNHLAGNGANPIQQLEIDRAAAIAIPDTTTSCSSRRGRGTTRPCNNPGPGETSLANFAGQPIPARIGGTGDHRRGERAAAIYTLIGTAKLSQVDPQAWLADALRRIADHPVQRLHELLPWNWKKPAPQAIAA